MTNLWNKMAGMETSALLSYILKVQVDAYGVFEIERLNRIIKEKDVKSVLDIGTGLGVPNRFYSRNI